MTTQPSSQVLDELLTPQQVAAYRGTTTGVLAQERFKGVGPRFIRDGRRIRYRASDIRDYIEASAVETASR
ncbi:DNA-binding protein [Mycolicibacterium boenickei]|uniref:DNA-binding protein n=1 Tax=Mycolicibacterium boenickei TaxID=146017 RepID=A0AAX3A5D7_9MYCO|nr:hypothetical protein [Mycolicibacterium boenickei]PEG59533.1 hypothetical protein CQY21_16930 [Mycolicibacterium boenickei]UNC02672.1 DNA-binding protein [Mycolicibacterium boenickei]BBX92713.1 hypothetical protein MBOE_43620 [Mycolicibacterium boenickei]